MIIDGGQLEIQPDLNFGKFILHHLRNAKPQNVCLEHYNTGEQLTYTEFIKYAISLSVALSELGVKKGDIVGVGSEQRIKFLPTTLSVMFTGATYTPFDLKTGTAVLNYKLNLSKPNYFICTALFWRTYGDVIKSCESIKTIICFDEIEDVKLSINKLILRYVDGEGFEPAAVEEHDIAVILYSSGTTGMSKGVPVTHHGFIISSWPCGFQDECIKVTLSLGEWYHRYDICSTYANLAAGRKIVFATDLSPDVMLRVVQDCQVNSALLVPSFVSYLAEKEEEVQKYELSSLKILYSTGAPLDANIIEEVKKRFTNIKKIVQSYGMSECGEITSECWCTKGSKPGSVGVAAPGMTLKVIDPKTREILGSNQRGEICIQGPAVMKGYLGTGIGSSMDEQGFLATGDIGYHGEDGYFYIVDRLKDMLCYDGNEVSPVELESILVQHPGVAAAGVASRPAGVLGDALVAFLVPRRGARLSHQDILDYMSIQATESDETLSIDSDFSVASSTSINELPLSTTKENSSNQSEVIMQLDYRSTAQ